MQAGAGYCVNGLVLVVLFCNSTRAEGYALPERVKVMPVVFVPAGEATPSEADQRLWLRHLAWTQERYQELLDGDTFELARESMKVVRVERPLDFYRNRPENGAPEMVVELLEHFQVSRFDNPYVFCVMVANPRDSYPLGGGRTINGGVNSGGGFMFISSHQLRQNKHFQTTLQHELGHSFGLPHPNVYGYDLQQNPSIMSYSEAHFTDGFKPSPTPGVLIPEDRRALAMNDRAFSKTVFDPDRHLPAGYKLFPKTIPLGPMTLPGLPDFYPQVTTDAGEFLRSQVQHVVSAEIRPSAGPGNTYDPATMWHSNPLPGGVATLTITFPFPVELTGLAIHSQHSGLHHAVTGMRLETLAGESPRVVKEQKITAVDAVTTFSKTTARAWKLTLTSGPSKLLVLRGLRFLNGDQEIVPHMVPYAGDGRE